MPRRVMPIRAAFFAIALAALAAPPALAERVYVAPELHLDKAEAVVVGKMTKVDAEAGTGVIAVEKILKGDANLKEIPARFSPAPRVRDGVLMIHSEAIRYTEGQGGVWVLCAANKDEAGRYFVNQPTLHHGEHKVDDVRKMLAELEKLPWSEPVDGLAARLLVHKQSPKAPNTLLYFAVKNVSDKPMRVVDYVAFPHMKVTLVDPNGDEGHVQVYSERLRTPPIAAANVPLLAPGEKRYIVFPYGFSTGTLNLAGKWTVKVSYTNSYDGKPLGLDGVWTGTVQAPAVTFEHTGAARPPVGHSGPPRL